MRRQLPASLPAATDGSSSGVRFEIRDRRGYHPSTILALDLALFSYLQWFRTHDIAASFWLYGDQVRDWEIALRSFSDLPLVGPPSLAGGNTAGPIYYWILWAIARVIGPFCDHLPHAGGIGISLLQGAGDVAIFHGLRRRLRSAPLALAIVLLVSTSGPDATISATIWNPPVAMALMKIGLAVAMLRGVSDARSLALVAAILWLGVQAHTTVLPVAAAVLGWAVISVPTWRAIAARAAVVAGTIAVLQVPWLIDRSQSHLPIDTPMDRSIISALTDPATLRPIASGEALMRGVNANYRVPWPAPVLGTAIAIGAAAVLALARDRLIQILAIAPLVCTVVLFAIWQGPLTENYWYLPNAIPAALCLTGWIVATPRRARAVLVAALLVLVVVIQPSNARYAWSSLRTPVYGLLVRGSRDLVRAGVPIREVVTGFPMPAGTPPTFLYSILGGRIDPTASMRGVLSASGRASFEAVEPGPVR